LRETLVLLLAALALTASACGNSSSSLVVVNGEEISLDDLITLDPTYGEIEASEEATFRDDLRRSIFLLAIETSARDEFDLEVSDSQVDSLFDSPPAEYTEDVANWNSLVASGQITENQAHADAKNFLVRELVEDVLATDADSLEDLWVETPQLFSTACVSHILTALEAEATAAIARIDAGEDFANVADEVSLDTGSAGGLLLSPETGLCALPLGSVIPEFGYEAAVAPIGHVHGPFETEFGWHVILVSERTGPESLAALQADPAGYLTDDVRTSLLNTWVASAIEGADVEVDPELGSWDEENYNIVPAEDG